MRRLWLMPLFIMLTLCAYCWGIGGFGFIDPYETLFYSHDFNLNNFINYLAFFIFGRSEFAGRIMQLVLGLACAFTGAFTAKILFHNRKITQTALFIILTSPLYFIVSRLNVPDIFFAFSFTLCIASYIYKLQNLDLANIFKYKNLAADLFLYSGMAFASLSGGFIRGTIAPLSIIISHVLIINWRWRKSDYKTINFLNLFSPIGIISYALIIPILFLNNYKLSSEIFFAHNLNKIYLLAFCPWMIFILIYAKKIFKFNINNFEPELTLLNQDDAILLSLWAAIAFIFNFPDLITPCIIPIAIFNAVVILENILESDAHRALKKSIFYLLCLFAALSLAFAIYAFNYIAFYKSHKEIAKLANEYLSYENNPEINFLYYGDMRGLDLYLSRSIANINDNNIINEELDWDVKTDNKRNMRRLWNGSKRILLIIKRSDLDEFKDIIGREPVKVGESAGDILLTNY